MSTSLSLTLTSDDLGSDLPAWFPQFLSLGAQIVANLADFNAKVDSIQATVASVVTEIQDLRAKIEASGMSGADEDAALARLTDIEAALAGALTQTPENGGGTPPVEPPPAP